MLIFNGSKLLLTSLSVVKCSHSIPAFSPRTTADDWMRVDGKARILESGSVGKMGFL